MNSPVAPNPDIKPWYRQFWPWALIAIPFLTVVASAITFWLAVSTSDPLVLDDDGYNALRSELRAQQSSTAESSSGDAAEGDG